MTREEVLAIIERNQRDSVRYNKKTEKPYFAFADCISKVTL